MRVTGKLSFNPVYDFFQTVGLHATHRPGLLSFPKEFFIVQINISEFVQVRIFATHIKHRNKKPVRITGIQCLRNSDYMEDLINKIQCASKNSWLMSSRNSKTIVPVKGLQVFHY